MFSMRNKENYLLIILSGALLDPDQMTHSALFLCAIYGTLGILKWVERRLT